MLEALAPGANISEIARRHDLRPQQVFTWIRQARRPSETPVASVTDLVAPAATAAEEPRSGVEIVVGEAVIFVGDDVPTPRLVEIIRAIRSK
jgi:transposase